jgi:hypothetical protein
MKQTTLLIACLILALITAACSQHKKRSRLPDNWAAHQKPCTDPGARSALEGAWLYEEDGYLYTLQLDARGNGRYQWQNGRFLTTCLEDGHWRGRWDQPDNDREGAFEIALNSGLKEGEGRWWYTRIGEDHEPAPGGGEFQLKRIEHNTRGYRPKIRLKTSRNSS